MPKTLFALVVGAWLALAPVPVNSARALPATDNLTRVASTLGSNWTATLGAITDWTLVDTGDVGASTAYAGTDFAQAYWNADAFGNDQYSQAVIKKGTNGYQGVGVRMADSGGADGYVVALVSGCTIYRFDNGSKTAIGSCSLTWSDGETLKTTAVGTTITVYQNGVSRGTATDATYASGSAGILGYGDSDSPRHTDWEGGNVSGGAASFVPAIIQPRGGGDPQPFAWIPYWLSRKTVR